MRILKARKRSGFTLIELLVVIAILGGLMTVLFVSLGDNKAKANKGQNKLAMNTDYFSIVNALDEFKAKAGRYPNADEGLEALVRQPSGVQNWDGPYLKKVPVDPYGTPYRYNITGSKFSVISLGADGREGGEKDDADVDLSTLMDR
ncbi:type II secretion system major pseudopilin GspG [Turneriella parva]|uniref:Type II secretion system protein G (GspG) n=1 Tax=Turneriella parva (strain ATCC BAA-1111 / DSM 21527 / NCTC 11395 / H) TaxID=869212 RepID=I4BAK8_TURPD|nr:type II secretion system major pseudopilin GspG [Turneriella parva]AFM14315.1 type II secretion system protein G (GspG) [Turneriella parva DSM 21527]